MTADVIDFASYRAARRPMTRRELQRRAEELFDLYEVRAQQMVNSLWTWFGACFVGALGFLFFAAIP